VDLKARLKQQLGGSKDKQKKKAEPVNIQEVEKTDPSEKAMESTPEVDLPDIVELPDTKKKENKKTKTEQDYLSTHELKYRTILLDKLLSVMDLARIGEIEPEKAKTQIQNLAKDIILEERFPVNAKSREAIVEAVQFEILGLGPLEYLIRDKRVSDIMINGAHNAFVERGGRLEKTTVKFDDDAHLMRIIDRIASQVGRRVDESSPMVDARLQDGSRVNAIVPPLALDGPCLSIRRFPADPLTLNDLIGFGAVTVGMAKLMTASVEIGKNILISGGTGSGKTTMLNSLSSYIPEEERIVTIEDAAELQLQQDHLVRLETRPPNIEGQGEITARDLVRNALRMRPDRIILGEIRGAEALDMLQAMNTGHDGSLATIHANTPRDALSRVENMVAMAGFELPIKAVRTQIASAIHLILQISRLEDGSRRMTALSEIVGMEGDVITTADIFVFNRKGVDEEGKVVGSHRPTGALPTYLDELRLRGIQLDLDAFDTMAE
jgi:pilus assembly protein CpaF